MDPKKIATIVVVSEEVVRANPGGFMNDVRLEAAEAFATAFDDAAAHGTNTPFGTWLDQTTKSVELGTATVANGGLYADINSGLALLVNDGKRLNGFAFDTRAEPVLNAAVDTSGRPLFVDSPPADGNIVLRPGRLLGRSAFIGDGLYKATGVILGYGGDWSQAAWGVVGGINYSVSNEAAVTIDGALVSLWENNLVAIRMEAEYGWLVNDTASFVKYANAT